MNQEKKITTQTANETQQFAKDFVNEISPGDIVTLSGELGAGKTTFVQGFAKGLGIEHRIISPTFMIMRTYQIKNNDSENKQNIKIFYHIDLYRVESEKDVASLGLVEILNEKDAVVFIEWPERLGTLLPKKRWDIRIESLSENERKITVKNIKYEK